MQIEKVYEPQRFEPHWAQWWIDSGIFHAVPKPGERYFSLVIPPPNVTGSLHMGHMLEHTLIDVAVRWHRMRGDNTLWVPGTDHAGIGTQMLVERSLAEQGETRVGLGREEFLKRVWEWKDASHRRISEQMKRLGSSCDWSREHFTLDPQLSRAVRETFVWLYEKGLIYRGEYMVNWCPRCQTAISDLETAHEDVQGSLWHIRYPINGQPGQFLTVATTRPETMLGDTAVAVNPSDTRYAGLRGATVRLPLMDRDIPVVFDDVADPQFGTGVVKVTPSHDPNDFEIGKRHNLPFIKVIGEDARMTTAAGVYAGKDRFDARKEVLADLEKQGLLEKVEPYALSLSNCYRCKTIVEPLASTQWFVKMKPLAEPAIQAVDEGRITFVPANWVATWNQWMHNIRDWCISRQLWWGHRIPAWYCEGCGKMIIAREDPTACPDCGSASLTQETDVLDTWFSSGLWPFSTLGWPDDTADLRAFYPTSLLITGFDILFFWVARMVMLGIEMTGQVPFRQVHLHGLVRDPHGQKMSKTKGNVIDPLTVNDQYGTDAVRFALVSGAATGMDIAFTPERLDASRSFANKIWNAARFLFMKMEEAGIEPCIPSSFAPVTIEDRWIVSRLNAAAESVNRAIEQHRYHEMADIMWHFLWDEFCDWYVELKKLRSDWNVVLAVFEKALRLLHPAMPFITEELWQRLAKQSQNQPVSIALAPFPEPDPAAYDAAAEAEMTLLQDIVTSARALRADHKVDRKLRLAATLYGRHNGIYIEAIERLANVKIDLQNEPEGQLRGAVRSTPDYDLVLHLPEADTAAQRGRLQKEIEQLGKLIANSERQLLNEAFLAKAPQKVVDEIRSKLTDYQAQLAKSHQMLEGL
jgi:valyl-tRNA synthetase